MGGGRLPSISFYVIDVLRDISSQAYLNIIIGEWNQTKTIVQDGGNCSKSNITDLYIDI